MDYLNDHSRHLLYILQAHPAVIIALDVNTGESWRLLEVPRGTPDGIQVDLVSKTVYWTNMGEMPETGENFIHADGSIESCSLAGDDHRVLVGGGSIVTPKQIQLDAAYGVLYWCDREGMAIFCCNTDGSGLTMLHQTGAWPGDRDDVMRHCVGIALDLQNRYIYWTQKGPPDGGQGRIFRMALTPPGVMPLAHRPNVELLLDHLPEPIDLEIDHESQRLYWTDRGLPEQGGNSLNCADISVDGLSNHRVLATGLAEAIGLALDLKGHRAFVSDLSGAVRGVSLEGGVFTTLYTCPGPVTGIAFAHHGD
ncbi:hypothetical protein [Pseudomonas parafulva]|uniref:hypothetical protein n=1 Tax=Pseudomonas parafulva TaxID=157782 RepID=UPI000423A5B9|nr:hypothetical protein [Pseudomonas parafulva]